MKTIFLAAFMYAAGDEAKGGTFGASPKNPKDINLLEKTKVYSNEKDPHHETGEEFECHPELAAHLIKIGMASKTEEEALKTKKTK